MDNISKSPMAGQAWKFYFAPCAWLLFLFMLPVIYHAYPVAAFIAVVFPCAYLFTWMGFLMHETWHKYVKTLPNNSLYVLLSLLLVSDPHIYKMVHGHYHTDIHSWKDMEFHPLGEIKNRVFLIINNTLEILIGVIFLVLASFITIPFDNRFKGRFRLWKMCLSVIGWTTYLGGIGLASASVFHVSAGEVAISYVLAFWAGSLLLHHSQLVEHGNLIVQGAWNERNLWTRNLSNQTMAGKFFLFLTHSDSREHVLHHTITGTYSRPIPGKLAMPDKAIVVTMRDYWTVIKEMLVGKMSHR